MNWKVVLAVFFLASALLLPACGSAGSGPDSPPAETAKETTVPPAPSGTPGKEAPDAEPSGGEAVDREWQQLVEAAKKEGKIFMSAPSGEVWRNAILEPWKEEYPEIVIEYSSHSGRDYYSKVFEEQKIGHYNWDLRIGGPNASAFDNLDAFEPIKPILRSELLRDEIWFQGLDGFWADKQGQYFPTWLARVNPVIHMNRDEADLTSYEQLLDPKYKGKIVLQSPSEGAGLGSLATVLHAYGEDFVRKLLIEQEVVALDDARMLAEQLVRGKYVIGLGVNDYHLKLFRDEGLGKNVEGFMDGPLAMSIGSGSIQMMKNAPHPNATKLFINWLLDKEAQYKVTHLTGDYNTRRTDVPPVNPELAIDPNRIDQLFAHQIEENLDIRNRAQDLAKELGY